MFPSSYIYNSTTLYLLFYFGKQEQDKMVMTLLFLAFSFQPLAITLHLICNFQDFNLILSNRCLNFFSI